MKRKRLLRRLRYLYIVEFINIFLLPFAFITFAHTNNQEIGINSVAAMILIGILLFEGSYLWFCVSRQLRFNKQYRFIKTFKILKTLNFVFFTVVLIIITVNPFLGTYDKIGTALFLLLAVLEYINYFEIQLMYDNKNDVQYLIQHRRLKTAKLKRLMAK